MNPGMLSLIIFICVICVAVVIISVNGSKTDIYIRQLNDEYITDERMLSELKEYNSILEKYRSDSKDFVVFSDNVEYETVEYTKNSVFDNVMSYERHKAEKMGIIMMINSSVSSGTVWKMNDSDTVEVLTNLLDNAIEGACRCTDRHINVDIKADKMTRMTIINSKDDKLEIDEKVIKTTKRNDREHGFGIPVIKEIVDKYNGKISMRDLGNEFCVCVEVPI